MSPPLPSCFPPLDDGPIFTLSVNEYLAIKHWIPIGVIHSGILLPCLLSLKDSKEHTPEIQAVNTKLCCNLTIITALAMS